ncbi:protease S8 tripeptidyl peptidase I [Cordyceps javanica]|uniref:Protease S8 tripeptidyl peptidase I n=1 Tax=Cordyceps javanica TaxID=43265 RepID=A0A545V5S2_9HYPO|nr:protease S8 tripeptidyl peptidase I [Cordyceps javanica]TQW08312.1 protease S8 tripeptidyl peptidase I [Cordyceps javanica]
MRLTAFLLSSLWARAWAVPVEDGSVVKSHSLSKSWESHGSLPDDTKIPVRIALKQKNLDKGMEYLLEVSHPKSPKYGQHYTQQEVIDLFSPEDETIDAVKTWLVKSGVPASSITSPKSKGFLDFVTTAGELNKLVGGNYQAFQYINGKSSQVLSENYIIPGEVSSHIDFIAPALGLPSKTKSRRSATAPVPAPAKATPLPYQLAQEIAAAANDTSRCAEFVTPKCIKALYNIPDGKLSNTNNRLGLYESDDELFTQEDLSTFFALFAPNIPATFTPKVDLINWGNTKPDPNGGVGEAALDFDVAYPVVYPQNIELFQARDNFNPYNGTVGIFNYFLDGVDGSYCVSSSNNITGDDPNIDGPPSTQCGAFKPTNVISFSYGWGEEEYPAGYRQCNEFMKLGLQGTSIVFSSGDAGVAGGNGGICLGNEGKVFKPQLGAACPFVTTVGSTYLASGQQVGSAEQATARFGSGGGFSNVWDAPSYQQEAVSGFFANYDPGFPFYTTTGGKIPSGDGVFNRAGRAYPDIAAVGDYGIIVFKGQVGRSGGTSMSAPIVAAIFTRINEERIRKGKSPIGFANPALYSFPEAFNDITIGGHLGTGGTCAGRGFSTAPGWDPVTGLGTPKYPELLKNFLALP